MLPKAILNKLCSIYLVSNTPAFLLKKFREQKDIFLLSKKHHPQQLIETIATINSKESLNLEDIAIAYSAAAALTFFSPSALENLTLKISKRELRWIRQILHIWRATYVPTDSIITTADNTNNPGNVNLSTAPTQSFINIPKQRLNTVNNAVTSSSNSSEIRRRV